MSEERGRELAELQSRLAACWNSDGPECVHETVLTLPRETLVALAMVNIGATAAEL